MKTATITIRIAEEEKEKLAAIALKKDVPVSQVVREACKFYLLEGEKRKWELIQFILRN